MMRQNTTDTPRRSVLIAAALILAFLIGGYWIYRKQLQSAKREEYRELAAVDEEKVASVSTWRKERMGDADALSRNPLNERLILPILEGRATRDELQEVRSWFNIRNAGYGYEDALLLDTSGRVRTVLFGRDKGPGPVAKQAIADALRTGRPILTDFHSSLNEEKIHLDLCIPLLGRPGASGVRRRLGALLLRIDPSVSLFPIIERWPAPSRSEESLIVRQDGADALLLNHLRQPASSALVTRIPISRTNVAAIRAALGGEDYFEGLDYNGRAALADLRAIPGTPWHLVSEVGMDEISAEVRHHSWLILSWVIFGITISIGLIGMSNRARLKSIFHALARSQSEGEAAQAAAAAALRESEGRFRLLVERSPEGVFLHGKGGLLYINPALVRILGGRGPEDFLGQDFIKRVAPEYREGVQERIRTRFVDGLGSPPRQVQLLRLDGSRIWVEPTAMLVDYQGVTAHLVFVHDISERKKHEDRQALDLAVLQRLADNLPLKDMLADILKKITGALGIESAGIRIGQGVDYPFVATCGYSPEFVEQERHLCPRAADGAPARDAAGHILLECLCGGVIRGIPDQSLPCVTKHGSLWVDRGAGFDPSTVMAPSAKFRGRCLEVGYRSLAFLPLRANDKVIGLLHLADRREGIFTGDQVEFLEGIASSIAVAIDYRATMEARAQAEEQLRQTQKMESVGRLAGGVAHDFNNLLTGITGYAEFLLESIAEDDPRRADAKEILTAAGRAAALTKQLLAFSRRQILNPQVLDLNATVSEMVKMLTRLIGEDIKLEVRTSARPCLIKADAGQIDQVLVNLAVNSRDAMPQGGTLTIQVATAAMPAAFFRDKPGLKLGPLVVLTVSDSGTGMTDEVKSKAFEPFFTTKEQGKGTGLGLSTVYGVVKQNNGEITLESKPGEGATFRIYFPYTEGAQAQAKGQGREERVPSSGLPGPETVLLVDDEAIIRELAERALAAKGYHVITAANGMEALAAIARHARPVDLVVTDVVMPGMSGRELARKIAEQNMSRRTLYMSGYTDDAIVRHGVLEPGLAFLNKPFAPNALLGKVREVLDGPADQAQA